MLRPATYGSNTAEPLAALEAALSKSSSGLLLGSALSLADVSVSTVHSGGVPCVSFSAARQLCKLSWVVGDPIALLFCCLHRPPAWRQA